MSIFREPILKDLSSSLAIPQAAKSNTFFSYLRPSWESQVLETEQATVRDLNGGMVASLSADALSWQRGAQCFAPLFLGSSKYAMESARSFSCN